MAEESYKPKPISLGKKTNSGKLRRYLIPLAIGLSILALILLIVKKYSRNPFEKVEILIQKKEIPKAARLNFEMLEEYPENRLALLMNGAVINFAIRELNITDNSLPFVEYEDMLALEDKTGVFLKQIFSRKYTLFPDSPYFLNDFCEFAKNHPESTGNPEFMVIAKRSLKTETKWKPVSEECREMLFTLITDYEEISGEISGDNLSLREKPDTKANTITRLRKGTRVLVKYPGFEESIGGKTAPWLYIYTVDGNYGWVFGGYVRVN